MTLYVALGNESFSLVWLARKEYFSAQYVKRVVHSI